MEGLERVATIQRTFTNPEADTERFAPVAIMNRIVTKKGLNCGLIESPTEV